MQHYIKSVLLEYIADNIWSKTYMDKLNNY